MSEYLLEQMEADGRRWYIIGSFKTSGAAQNQMRRYVGMFRGISFRVSELPSHKLIVCQNGHGQPLIDERREALERVARRSVRSAIKMRARVLIRNGIHEEFDGHDLIAQGLEQLAYERAHLRRWYGFGGEVPGLNARAHIMVGRWLNIQRLSGRFAKLVS